MSVVNSSVPFLSHFWFMHTLLCWQLGIQLLISIPARAVPASLITSGWITLGWCFLTQEGWIWPRAETASGAASSQHLSPARAQGRALVCHCSSTKSIFNRLDPIHKHTLSAGNEAEHYVMHSQELKQSLGVSSNFLLSLFRLPQPSPAQSVTAALHQCNLLK